MDIKDYKKAEHFYDVSLKIARAHNEKISISVILLKKATMFKRKGDYDNSIKCLKQVNKHNIKTGNEFGKVIVNFEMYNVFKKMGKQKDAIAAVKKAYELSCKNSFEVEMKRSKVILQLENVI